MRERLTQRIQGAATKLKRRHLAEMVDTLIPWAQEGQVGYREVLDLVLEAELGVREGRWFKQALKLAGRPYHKTLDSFDFAFPPDLDVVRVKELATLRFVEQKGNAIFLGPAHDRENPCSGGAGHHGLSAGIFYLLHHVG